MQSVVREDGRSARSSAVERDLGDLRRLPVDHGVPRLCRIVLGGGKRRVKDRGVSLTFKLDEICVLCLRAEGADSGKSLFQPHRRKPLFKRRDLARRQLGLAHPGLFQLALRNGKRGPRSPAGKQTQHRAKA